MELELKEIQRQKERAQKKADKRAANKKIKMASRLNYNIEGGDNLGKRHLLALLQESLVFHPIMAQAVWCTLLFNPQVRLKWKKIFSMHPHMEKNLLMEIRHMRMQLIMWLPQEGRRCIRCLNFFVPLHVFDQTK